MTLLQLKNLLGEYYDTHDHAGIDDVGAACDLLSNALAQMENEDPQERLQGTYDRQLCDWKEGERI